MDYCQNNMSMASTRNNNVTTDWTVRENVRAQMRVMIKRILRRYGYPPDKQARATELVLEQAEVLSRDLAEAEVYRGRT